MRKSDITDEQLKAASAKVWNAMLDSLPKDGETPPVYSVRFLSQMEHIAPAPKSRRRIRTSLLRAAVIFCAVLAGSTVILAANSTAALAFRQWTRELRETFVRYTAESPSTTAAFTMPPVDCVEPAFPLPDYSPAWVPDGFDLSQEHYIPYTERTMQYHNADGTASFSFSYMRFIEGSTLSYFTGPDRIISEKVHINNSVGDIYRPRTAGSTLSTGSSVCDLIWIDEQYEIIFSICGNLSRDELIRIAESVVKE